MIGGTYKPEKLSIMGPDFIQDNEEATLSLESMAAENTTRHRIDLHSSTWLAIKEFMKKQAAEDYMPILRRRDTELPATQYARGALDAFDSLLELAGEEV